MTKNGINVNLKLLFYVGYCFGFKVDVEMKKA